MKEITNSEKGKEKEKYKKKIIKNSKKNFEERRRSSIRNGNGTWFRVPWGTLGCGLTPGSWLSPCLDVK